MKIRYFVLGDKAFMLTKYTMKPFEGNPEAGSKERVFNYRLSRARRVVEDTFGILSSGYRVLRKPILLEPEKATKVVLATVYLYNYSIPPEYYDREVDCSFITGQWRNNIPSTALLPLTAIPRRGTVSAKDIRLHLATHFVTNGIIPWQHQY
ncbi:unnamed protein product [Arctia plantaginis]|uniref:DDE Tnp4 domain-containing protein n=1 Tax=Arctia plantaginis TaxID=874455 RepID=A0A8S1BFQ9_ARCPL|nr:unnamed protein product [Arctia plantaginis]